MTTFVGKIFGGIVGGRGPQPSLRIKILLVALLLGTVPLLIAAIILPLRVEATLTRRGHQYLSQAAHDLATMTQNDVQRNLETMRSFASLEPLRDAVRRYNAGTLEPAALAEVNRQMGPLLQGLSANQYQSMFLCGADGFTFAGVLKTGETAPLAHVDLRDRAYFDRVRATLRPVVSDPVRSKISNVPIMVIAVPFTEADGRFAGLIGLSVEIGPLSAIISGQRLGETGYPFAIDRDGLLVAHPDTQRVFRLDFSRVNGAEALAARMLRGETGVEAYVSSRGEHKLAAFAPVPICGWSIAASMNTAEFVEPAERIRSIIFAMIGACVVIAVVVAIAFGVGLEELKRALLEARASEVRFKLLASVTSEAVWDWDLATGALWWNEGVTRAFGYTPAEAGGAGEEFLLRVPAEERERVTRAIRGTLSGGGWVGEHGFVRRDGTRAYVLHRVVAVKNPKGHALRLIGGMTDISERRATEDKLAQQAALIDQTRDGILVRGLDQAIRFWNRGAERIYGWTPAEAVGRRADELLRIDAGPFAEAVQRVLEAGAWSGHLVHTTKEGAKLTVDCRWTLLRDDDGRPKAILAIDTDVTERKQMEAKFLRAQRLESIGTLAGGIAHDLNNLLSPIVIGVGMLKLAPRDADDAKIIDCIEQSAMRGTGLVKQVLSFARGVEGARVAVHVGYIAREVEAIARSTFPKNIALRVEVAKDVRLISADPTQINQVLLNLCVNARDAMPQGGQLRLRAANVELDERFVATNGEIAAGAYVVLEVSDTGTGMPKEIMEKLFEPFFTTKAPGKGTGLGLSTVIGIARSHGGTVNVYSEPGKGSTFKVYLPAAAPDATAAGAGPVAAPPAGRGELILLVDDEERILNITKRALENSGYRVLTATDGAQAFSLYHEHRARIALVLTDMMMPVMDGTALVAALRRIDPGVVVVGASGLSDNNNQIKAADTGIRHFLCKPYTMAAMLNTIAAALRERISAEIS